MSKWISVKDGLPKERGEYYVYPDSARRPRFFNGANFIGGDYSGCWKIYPTYWMPLPEPPEGEKQ